MSLLILLRIAPYALALYLAVQKGYTRLAVACLIGISLAVIGAFGGGSDELKDLLRGLFAMFILLHVIDLRGRAS